MPSSSMIRGFGILLLNLSLTSCGESTPSLDELLDQNGLTVTVPASGVLTGTIGLEGFGNCAGIAVQVSGPDNITSTTTTENGQFEISNLPPGAYLFSFSAPDHQTLEENFVYDQQQPADVGSFVLESETVPVAGNLSLADGKSPAGSVVAVTGETEQPLPEGVECESSDPFRKSFERTVLADARGRYQADVPRRTRRARARAERGNYTSAEVEISSDKLAETDTETALELSDMVLYPLTGFVNIVGGATQADATITLQVSAFNANQIAVAEVPEGDACRGYGSYFDFDAEFDYTVTGGDGDYTICVMARNATEDEVEFNRDVLIDTTPPSNLSADVDDNAGYVQAAAINLDLQAVETGSGLATVRIVDNGISTGELPFGTTVAHTLVNGSSDGAHTLEIYMTDRAGHVAGPITTTTFLDLTDPAPPAVTMNNGDSTTGSRAVDIDIIVADSDVVAMQTSENSGFAGANWVAATHETSLQLSSGDGPKTVFVRLRDAAGRISTFGQDTIQLDSTPPGTPTITLNNGNNYSNAVTLNVGIGNLGDATEMLIDQDASFSGAVWQNALAATTISLTGSDGSKTIYIKTRDATGNESGVNSAGILLDTQPPLQQSLRIDNGAAKTASLSGSVTLNLFATDATGGSGIASVKLGNSLASAQAALSTPFAQNVAWTLSAPLGDGVAESKTVWAIFRDAAGNQAPATWSTIGYDRVTPTGGISFDQSATNDSLTALSLNFDSDATQMKLSHGADCAGGSWSGVTDATLWSLSLVNGIQYASVRFRDDIGNEGTCYSDSLRFDTVGPQPQSFSLSGNAAAQAGYSNEVTLTAQAAAAADSSGCDFAELAEDIGFLNPVTTADCSDFPYSYTLLNQQDGSKSLYLRFYDDLGNPGSVTQQTLILDRTAPVASDTDGFTIAAGQYTADPDITLQLNAAQATRVRFGQGTGCGFTAESYAGTKSLTLAGLDGTKTVSLQYLDDAGNSSNCFDRTITLDTSIDPLTVSLQGFDGNLGTTSEQGVTVTLNGVDSADAVEMRVSNLAGFTGASWEPLQTSFAWFLPSGDGSKNVYVAIRDRAGNTQDNNGNINLDQTPPDAPALQVIDTNNDSFALSSEHVELSWSTPADSDRYELQRLVSSIDVDFITIANPTAFQSTYNDTVTRPGNNRNYRIRAIDAVGNTSAWSIVAEALPFDPITKAVWVRDVDDQYSFDFLANNGMFSLSGQYVYEDVTGDTFTSQLVDNQTTFEHLANPFRYNDSLELRTGNADNSLVYESSIPLNIQGRTTIDDNFAGTYSSIVVDSQGYAHIAYEGSLGRMYYTTNRSGSWVIEQVGSNCCNARMSLGIDDNGDAHISHYNELDDVLKYATNTSGNWVVQDVDTTGDNGEYNSLVLDASGNAHIAYYHTDHADLKYATNASASWVTETVDASGDVGKFAALDLDSDQDVHISFHDDSNGRLIHTSNASGSWVTTVVDDTVADTGWWTSLYVDTDDKLHISYFDRSNRILKYATNAPGPWNTETVDSTDLGLGGGMTSLIGDASGNIHIAYYDYNSENLKYANGNLGGWQDWELDTAGLVGRHPSIAVDSARRAHISYYDSSKTALKYLTNGSGAGSIDQIIDGAPDSGWFADLVLDKDGAAHVSYFDRNNYDLQYATNASGAWQIVDVDTSNLGIGGGETSIALDSSGNIHISYYDYTNQDLKYATNASGIWQAETVDSTNAVGRDSAIVVSADDTVHISYQYSTDNNLKYASGTFGSWTLETVDSNFAGSPSSIDLDSSGNVHIVYGQLLGRLYHATNASGSWVLTQIANDCCNEDIDITIAADDTIHVSSYDGSDNRLIYLNNSSGPWVIAEVDSGDDVGEFNSIAIAADGRIHISYYDASNGRLKYANNVLDEWTARRLDQSSADIGKFTSIAVDSTGRGHVVYHDVENETLKHATHFNGVIETDDVQQVSPF